MLSVVMLASARMVRMFFPDQLELLIEGLRRRTVFAQAHRAGDVEKSLGPAHLECVDVVGRRGIDAVDRIVDDLLHG